MALYKYFAYFKVTGDFKEHFSLKEKAEPKPTNLTVARGVASPEASLQSTWF